MRYAAVGVLFVAGTECNEAIAACALQSETIHSACGLCYVQQ